ncbi:unnamed protein product [Spirodela intermedia]|uniref:Uncharacterized protein n=2 Tax=Spirodela intermedia TaxID=51605 RepID=A0A7I8JJH0_SPIIN|nr:unnamed protein product [Spirodela intermedia]CAA6669572.1 unnamed protein product [Spirodela intermedia]CAA7406541.1 unnamed protein product [Spirodela intermedia]
MDFHSLPRRDLQSLCKMNKIPANMTNIAMADALQALSMLQAMEEKKKRAALATLDDNCIFSPGRLQC